MIRVVEQFEFELQKAQSVYLCLIILLLMAIYLGERLGAAIIKYKDTISFGLELYYHKISSTI